MKTLLGMLVNVLKFIIKKFLGSDGKPFLDFMKAEIEVVMNENISSDEKRKEIQRKAREYLKERGLEVSSSLVNLAIEIYYNWLKGQTDEDDD